MSSKTTEVGVVAGVCSRSALLLAIEVAPRRRNLAPGVLRDSSGALPKPLRRQGTEQKSTTFASLGIVRLQDESLLAESYPQSHAADSVRNCKYSSRLQWSETKDRQGI